MKKKINFLIVGAQKSGTTALDAYLRLHPEICMASEKEVHFFDNEAFFAQEPVDYSIYHKTFAPNARHKLLGECTPIYMYWHDAPKRIWQYNPEMKIIIILRNPIERAFSHWNMERCRNAEHLSFWDAISNEQQRCQETLPFQHRVFSYLDRGFYVKQLQKIWQFFPKQNTLVLRHEDLRKQHSKTLADVFCFLGIEEMSGFDEQVVFSIPYQSEMTQQEKMLLLGIFRDEILNIERLLDWDCSDWMIK